jgi:hypothetical protein
MSHISSRNGTYSDSLTTCTDSGGPSRTGKMLRLSNVAGMPLALYAPLYDASARRHRCESNIWSIFARNPTDSSMSSWSSYRMYLKFLSLSRPLSESKLESNGLDQEDGSSKSETAECRPSRLLCRNMVQQLLKPTQREKRGPVEFGVEEVKMDCYSAL